MNLSAPEVQEFLDLLAKKEKMVAMLAPSFPIVFEYPQIVGQLKRLGFVHVIEVSRGAAETNCQLLDFRKKNRQKRLIASPCPALVRLIRKKYPHLVQFLSPTDSPMVASAKIVLEKFPGCRPVFIGPCPVKRLEAKEDHPELKIIVLTYKEIKEILSMEKIKSHPDDILSGFDLIGSKTRLYSISGGLSQSSNLNYHLSDEELDVVSGLKNAEKSLNDFPKNRLKLLDILFCEGGCISGLGIETDIPLDKRRAKIIAHWVKIAK
jgi:iron only hydrogenase large subunit-like protein